MKNKTKRKLKLLTIMIMTVAITILNISYINADALNLKSSSAILMDIETGDVIYQKNGYEIRQIASLTKVMTSLVALEEGNLDSYSYIEKESASVKGTSFKLKEGLILPKKDLLYGLLYISGNDAGDAIARSSQLGYDGFINKMNGKASQIGMNNSKFYDPHGLGSYGKSGAKNNYSTAYDLALLMKEAIKNPNFISIQQQNSVNTENPAYKTLSNESIFMKTYQGAIGGKTGYTANAGNCQMVAASKNGKTLVGVILNAPKGARDKETIALMDYGFNVYNPYSYESLFLNTTQNQTSQAESQKTNTQVNQKAGIVGDLLGS